MDEDSRYPNRKKPAEPPQLNFNLDKSDPDNSQDKPPDAGGQEPNSEPAEEEPLHYSGYKIIEPEPEPEPESLVDIAAQVEPQPPIKASVASVTATEKNPAAEPATPRSPFLKTWIERIRKFFASQTKIFATAGVSLGVLLGVVIAYWFMGNGGPYDLGGYASSGAGLKGHLYTKWEKKGQYRLTIEPNDPSQRAGFALAVAHSPRPLSIEIHLLDAHGFALCGKEIILKYDARNVAAFAAPAPDSPATAAAGGKISKEQLEQEIENAQWEAREPERELDADIFQNQIGQDGQIVSIHAQGDLPCSKKAYAKIFSWSFSSSFPSLAEQDELQKSQAEAQAAEARRTAEALAAHKKRAPKPAIKLLPFSIEGDDSVVSFDATRGVIETRGGKFFLFDKSSRAGTDSRWQDYPVNIHYKCDRASNCVLMHEGLGGLPVKLSR